MHQGGTRLALSLLAIFVFSPSALPQASTSSLSGTVRDQSGAVMPGVRLTLTNTGTNVHFDTTTSELDGRSGREPPVCTNRPTATSTIT